MGYWRPCYVFTRFCEVNSVGQALCLAPIKQPNSLINTLEGRSNLQSCDLATNPSFFLEVWYDVQIYNDMQPFITTAWNFHPSFNQCDICSNQFTELSSKVAATFYKPPCRGIRWSEVDWPLMCRLLHLTPRSPHSYPRSSRASVITSY